MFLWILCNRSTSLNWNVMKPIAIFFLFLISPLLPINNASKVILRWILLQWEWNLIPIWFPELENVECRCFKFGPSLARTLMFDLTHNRWLLPPFCLQMSKEVTKSKEVKNRNKYKASLLHFGLTKCYTATKTASTETDFHNLVW